MTPSEKVRTDKLSSQVRKMVGEWHKGPQSESFATPRHVMAMCADALESLLPQIEALEQISSPQPSLGKDSPAKRDSDTQAVAPKSGDGLVLCGLDIASDAQIEHMVDRFLGWPLPKNFNPDAGISFRLLVSGNAEYPYPWPTGTNLFDSLQAEDMVRYMLEGIETPALLAAEEKRLGQLDIILRETEQVDDEEEAFLANDYGGTGWECEEIMNKIRIAVNRWKNKAKAADKGSNSIVLHGVDAEKFAETLLNPPAPNEALRAAAARSREDELLRTAYELLCECEHVEETDERGMNNFVLNVRERLRRKEQAEMQAELHLACVGAAKNLPESRGLSDAQVADIIERRLTPVFEALVERIKALSKAESVKTVRSCNRHDDCDKADEAVKAKGGFAASHCHDECCDECFGA